MTRHKSTRLLALLIALILCMSQASAVNIVHEEDYEVVPDYSQMDVEAAVTTYLSKEMKLNPAAVCGILANMEYESDFSPIAVLLQFFLPMASKHPGKMLIVIQWTQPLCCSESFLQFHYNYLFLSAQFALSQVISLSNLQKIMRLVDEIYKASGISYPYLRKQQFCRL